MTQSDNGRPVGNTPITDASAATAPQPDPATLEYPVDVSNNADHRVSENDHTQDAAITATGADIDNDHTDEDAQAQTVADDSVRWKADQVGYGDSERSDDSPDFR
jgi:hypothetical protein